VYVNMRKL